jgi:hypothetical protein
MYEGTKKRIMRSGPLIALALLVGVASAQPPTEGSNDFFQLLRNDVGIRDRDLSTLRSTGQALAVVLPAHERGRSGCCRGRVPPCSP